MGELLGDDGDNLGDPGGEHGGEHGGDPSCGPLGKMPRALNRRRCSSIAGESLVDDSDSEPLSDPLGANLGRAYGPRKLMSPM